MEKLTIYECGFTPFEDARIKFEVKYFLVAILFIIFDLEISFLFPWSIIVNKFISFGFFVLFIFLFVLTLGFIYEWFFGALDW